MHMSMLMAIFSYFSIEKFTTYLLFSRTFERGKKDGIKALKIMTQKDMRLIGIMNQVLYFLV